MAQRLERLKLSTPIHTDTPISGLVTPYAEEVAQVAFHSKDQYNVWKTSATTAWVMRKKYSPKKEGVFRLIRVRKVELIRVGVASHVICSCKSWDMRRHGCRHITWAIGPQPTPGFFDPLWTVAHVANYGRKGCDEYTSMYDTLRQEGGLPGPCVTLWDSVAIGDVAGNSSEASKKRVRAHMMEVEKALQPVEVDPTGTKLLIAAVDGDGRFVTCEDFEGKLVFDAEFPGPPTDQFDIDEGSGSNTTIYNDFRDVAQRLSGPCQLPCFPITFPAPARTAHRTFPDFLLSFGIPFRRVLLSLSFHLCHECSLLSPPFRSYWPTLPSCSVVAVLPPSSRM